MCVNNVKNMTMMLVIGPEPSGLNYCTKGNEPCEFSINGWGVQASKLVIDAKDLIFGRFDRDDRPTIT